MCRELVQFYQELINFGKTGILLRGKYANIFRDVFVRLAPVEYIFWVSLGS